MVLGWIRSGRSMARRWRRLFCRCRTIACRFFSGEGRMDLPQRTRSRKDKEIRRGGDKEKWSIELSPCLLVSRSPCLTFCALCVLCGGFLFVSANVVAAPQEVVPVDGAAFRGELVSIDAGGRATFRVADSKEKAD